MEVRELRLQTGLSQSKFAKMFDIPVSTLKDWE
ncbi:MAG: helix-turn-helix domain-containing protein [Agathobacter sp.]|nr:helix-turn-helix domain-containing protein [Agathobacter sp.]